MIENIEIQRLEETLSKYKSSINKRYALICFHQYWGDDKLPINEFNKDVVEGYLTWLVKSGKSTNTIELYRRELRTIIKDTYPQYAEQVKEVFSRPAAKRHSRKGGLSSDMVRRLAKLQFGNRVDLAQARDTFMFSFYCGGVNFDVLKSLTKDVCDDDYIHLSANRRVAFTLNHQAIIAMYDQADNDKLFPFCSDLSNLDSQNRLKEIGDNCRMPQLAEQDAATKAWISVAKELGIDISVIAACADKPVSILSNYSGNICDEQKSKDIAINKVSRDVADNTQHWYAMRLRRRAMPEDILSILNENTRYPYLRSIQTYYPMQDVDTRVGNKLKHDTKAYISSVLFFRTKPQYVRHLSELVRQHAWIYRQINAVSSPYAVISQREMENFQRTVSCFTDDIEISLVNNSDVIIGKKVKIMTGKFAGCEGIVEDEKNSLSDLRNFIIRFTSENSLRFKIAVNEAQFRVLE